MELLQMSVRTLSEKIKNRTLGVAETVACLQERIRRTEPEIGAFLTLQTEEALQSRIKEVQEGIRTGRYAGPLAGVPIAVKDNICTKGMRTTCGSRMLESFVPDYNATVMERLFAAGMIVLGKTNMDEFAMGSTGETSAYQVTKNPWDITRTPGGSSSGSCAAVAAGEVTLALGSDTGGSVRQPAAWCGVVGMKPTYGRVSRYGLVAYASSLDQIGPIGNSVADCAALYEILVGEDDKDATTARREGKLHLPEPEQAVEALKGKKIALPKEYLGPGTQKEVREAVLAAAKCFEAAGAVVEEVSMPMTEYGVATYYLLACAEASSNLARFDGVKYGYRTKEEGNLHEMYKKSRSEGFGEEVKRRILLGTFVLSEGYYEAYYVKAMQVKEQIRREFDRIFSTYDCILTPTAPTTAPKLTESLTDPLLMYLKDADTVAVNLAGLPAISVPCGFDEKGLPIGLQLIANRWEEERLFTIARAYEELRGRFPKSYEEER